MATRIYCSLIKKPFHFYYGLNHRQVHIAFRLFATLCTWQQKPRVSALFYLIFLHRVRSSSACINPLLDRPSSIYATEPSVRPFSSTFCPPRRIICRISVINSRVAHNSVAMQRFIVNNVHYNISPHDGRTPPISKEKGASRGYPGEYFTSCGNN